MSSTLEKGNPGAFVPISLHVGTVKQSDLDLSNACDICLGFFA